MGTLTVAAINGVATFSTISLATLGTYTLSAVDTTDSLTSIPSASFVITAGAASQLVFSQQPTNALSGVAISPAIVVQIEDAGNNLITTDNSNVTLSINSGPSGTLGGTVTVAAHNGIATFSNVSLIAGGAYTLTAADATDSLTSSPSDSFDVFTVTSTATLVSSANPSTYGQTLTFTATVALSSGAATGNVTFKDHGVNIGTAPIVAGKATLNATLLAGSHSISASYPGTATIQGASSTNLAQTVNKASLSVTGITASDKTYNANTAATLNFSGATFVGLVNGDVGNVGLSTAGAAGSFAHKTVGTALPVTITGLQISGSASANYTLVTPTASASILPLQITASITVADKNYDGTTAATIATRKLTGVIIGDSVACIGGTATFADSASGLGKLVTAVNLALTGADAANYTINTTATAFASIIDTQPPAIPTGVNSTALSPISIKTTWNLNGNSETSVYVMRWNGSAWVLIATLGPGSTTYTDANLTPNTSYFYDIVAANAFGNSWAAGYSGAATLPLAAPGSPSALSATALSASAIRINWTLNEAADTGVYVLRWNGSAWAIIATLAAGSTTYTDNNLAATTAYYYDLIAFNAGGQTWAATYCGATTQAIPTAPPLAATNLSATVLSSSSVRINWKLNGGGESTIYVAKWNGSSWQMISLLPQGTTTFTDTAAVAGNNFYLVITANNFGWTWSSTYASAVI